MEPAHDRYMSLPYRLEGPAALTSLGPLRFGRSSVPSLFTGGLRSYIVWNPPSFSHVFRPFGRDELLSQHHLHLRVLHRALGATNCPKKYSMERPVSNNMPFCWPCPTSRCERERCPGMLDSSRATANMSAMDIETWIQAAARPCYAPSSWLQTNRIPRYRPGM